MKMTLDTRKHLALALEELTTQAGDKRIQDYRHNVRYTKCQYTAFIWGLYHALQQPDKTAIRANQGNPLADAHIETALKQILKEYR